MSDAFRKTIYQDQQIKLAGLGDCSTPEVDFVDFPPHYREHPSGIECIEVVEHMNFCLGNAVKYIWRAGSKHDSPIEDLKKAAWYLNREIERLE